VEMDQWFRRHIRMCCWKQWGRKRRIKELIKLGAGDRHAIMSVPFKWATLRSF